MATHKHDICMPELRVALARRDWKYWQLAAALQVHPSTLSAWLHQRKRGPRDLRQRCERVMGMESGTLAEEPLGPRALLDREA